MFLPLGVKLSLSPSLQGLVEGELLELLPELWVVTLSLEGKRVEMAKGGFLFPESISCSVLQQPPPAPGPSHLDGVVLLQVDS